MVVACKSHMNELSAKFDNLIKKEHEALKLEIEKINEKNEMMAELRNKDIHQIKELDKRIGIYFILNVNY